MFFARLTLLTIPGRQSKISFRAILLAAWFVCSAFFSVLPAARAQFSGGLGSAQNSAVNSSSLNSSRGSLDLTAQAIRGPASNILPTDATPPPVGQERSLVAPPWRFRLFQKLPTRLWFNATTEEDQRVETNVYQTHGQARTDYVFRSIPNVTVGYNVLAHGSIYCNYFVIKDVFARNEAALGPPTTQSVSLGLRRDWDLTSKTNFQIDYQTRELWIQSHTRQADLLPAINISHVVSPSCVAYVGGLLQLRSNYFGQGGTREIDPFYSGGIVYRRGDWVFVASDTLVTNFRRQSDIVPLGACNMVADFEVFRPVNQRVAPGLVYFTRVEPIFNWSDHKIEGQSGIDVRIYNGFRFNMTKPAYHQTMETLRKQIQEAEDEDEASRKKNAPAPAAPGGTAPATTPSIIPSIQVEPNPAAPGTGPVPSPSN